jgi:hypothetical protein
MSVKGNTTGNTKKWRTMKVRIGLVNAIERIVRGEQNKIIDLPIKYHSFTEFVNIACARLIQDEEEAAKRKLAVAPPVVDGVMVTAAK